MSQVAFGPDLMRRMALLRGRVESWRQQLLDWRRNRESEVIPRRDATGRTTPIGVEGSDLSDYHRALCDDIIRELERRLEPYRDSEVTPEQAAAWIDDSDLLGQVIAEMDATLAEQED